MTVRRKGQWWQGAFLGDKILTVVAFAHAAVYCLWPGNISTSVAIAQGIISCCFVPFFWIWRSKPLVSSCGFICCLAMWSVTWFMVLPRNTGISLWLLTAPMAVFSTARYCADRRIPRTVLAVMFLGTFVSPVMWRIQENFELKYHTGRDFVFVFVSHWILLLLAYFVGARFFGKQQYQQTLENERLSKLHSAQEEEKLRIARELHDVLAHSLTLMKVQSNAGLVATKNDPTAAVAALEQIRDTSDEALREVRHIVQALRSPETVALEPSKQLSDIPGIIEGFRTAGLDITATVPSELPPMSALTQLAITRIITEALTNALRHQGVGARVTIALSCTDSADLEMNSWSNIAPEQLPGAQAGLIGLAERARSLGGSFSATGSVNHFCVCASIPRGSEQ